jgi:arginine-tRNA-protein transferase
MVEDQQPAVFVEEFPCAYFSDGRLARIECRIIDMEITQNFHHYLAEGYRRLGRALYRTICPCCKACIPLRLPTAEFRMTKSLRRTRRVNQDISLTVTPPGALTPEEIDLFRKYLVTKHTDPERQQIQDMAGQLGIIHYGYAYSFQMRYYLQHRLAGVGIVDLGFDAVSSHYFYYDTALLRRRLGIYSILQEIDLACLLGKKYYYLGFYIQGVKKMSYKAAFVPHELLINGVWQKSDRTQNF